MRDPIKIAEKNGVSLPKSLIPMRDALLSVARLALRASVEHRLDLLWYVALALDLTGDDVQLTADTMRDGEQADSDDAARSTTAH